MRKRKNNYIWPCPIIEGIFDNGEIVRLSCARPTPERMKKFVEEAYRLRVNQIIKHHWEGSKFRMNILANAKLLSVEVIS